MTNFFTLGEKEEKKETVFTHYLDRHREVKKAGIQPTEWDNVLHIGYDRDYGDVFKVWDDGSNGFAIYFGEKGGEF